MPWRRIPQWLKENGPGPEGGTASARLLTSQFTDQAIRAAVDRGVATLRVAAERVQSQDLPGDHVSLGVAVNLGVILLEMKLEVPTRPATAAGPGDLTTREPAPAEPTP